MTLKHSPSTTTGRHHLAPARAPLRHWITVGDGPYRNGGQRRAPETVQTWARAALLHAEHGGLLR